MRPGRADPPGQADGIGRDHAIGLAREVVRPDRGRRGRVRAPDPDLAAALRAQVADRGGERRKRVQRVAEPVERERLDVVLEVRRRPRRIGFRERAELRWRHGQGPAPEQEILEAHARAPEQAVRILVQRPGVLDLVDQAQLEMVLEVRADAFERVDHRDAVLLEQLAGADARELEELRRADRARGEQQLAAHRRVGLAARPAGSAGRPRARPRARSGSPGRPSAPRGSAAPSPGAGTPSPCSSARRAAG